jgi:hypothetical protein
VSEPYQDIVTNYPPEKSPEGDAVILQFQTRSGEVIRLRLSADIERHLGTQLLLLAASSR